MIRNRTCNKGKKHRRSKFSEPKPTDIKFTVSDIKDVLAKRGGLQHDADVEREIRQHQRQHSGSAEYFASS